MNKITSVNKVVLVSVFLVFALSMIFVTLYMSYQSGESSSYFSSYNKVVTNNLQKVLKKQAETDELIRSSLKNKDYTLEKPFILDNPYGISPLSAIIIFNTPNEVSVDLLINDKLVTTIEASKEHAIPVYGLFANTNNYVTIKTSDGLEHTYTISTSSYNFMHEGIEVNTKVDEDEAFFLLSGIESNTPLIRAFDENDNMNFYLSFDHINSFTLKKDFRFLISYNSKKAYNNDYSDYNKIIEMDYLGKIYSISNDISAIKNDYNYSSNNSINQGYVHQMYNTKISNYQVLDFLSNHIKYDSYGILKTDEIAHKLSSAPNYKKNFDIFLNGNDINILMDSDGYSTKLLLVSKKADIYVFDLKANATSIKTRISTDLEGEYALYIDIDGDIYSLATTIKN